MINVFFETPGRPLRDILLDRYLIPAGRWLIGAPTTAYLLPQAAGSNWECALASEYLLDLRTALTPEAELAALIPVKVSQTVRWMVSQSITDPDGTTNWEGVTWDTAVCVRALMRAITELPNEFSDAERERIAAVSVAAIHWLVKRFEAWDTEVMYPYGPADVAQILSTLVYVDTVAPQTVRAACHDMLHGKAATNSVTTEIIDDVARYLIAAGDTVSASHSDGISDREGLTYWSDSFQSGEVLDCLVAYTSQCHETANRVHCKAHVVAGIRYFEYEQVDGKWGSHGDTCRALYGYLRATDAIDGARQEHHVVLKALRWMCDEKQTFRDGSFMHTPFVTVFYVAALWEVYARWRPATMPVGEVYDIALWSAPVRATEERGLRLGLQVEADRLRDDSAKARLQLETLRERVAGSLAIGVAVTAGVVTAWFLSLFEATVVVRHASTFVEYVAVVLAVALAAGGFAARLSRR